MRDLQAPLKETVRPLDVLWRTFIVSLRHKCEVYRLRSTKRCAYILRAFIFSFHHR